MGKKIQYIGRYVMDGRTLGKGSFARVELATHGVTKCKVAIKIIDTRKITEEYVRNNLYREAKILAQMRHPNIIRLYETLKATTLYCLVTEYAAGGELLEYLKTFKEQRLPETAARPFVRQLISALHYLHERNIVHRDLKMENIMLNESRKCIKIVDFGLSNSFSKGQLLKTHCGSPEYAAPELFTTGKEYGCEIDIWSLGVIMYALVAGKLPFTTPYTDQYRRAKLLQQIQKGLIAKHDKEMTTVSTECRNLLRQLIEPNPELRLPLAEIEAHPWVTRNGMSPFRPYSVMPRDKVARQQPDAITDNGEVAIFTSAIKKNKKTKKKKIVAELSDSLDMSKENVDKQVKDNASDELSAMYNMKMDERREQEGWFNKDHTFKTPPGKSQTTKCKERTCPSNEDPKRTPIQNHASKKPVKSRSKVLVKQTTRSCVTNPDLNTRRKKSIPDTATFSIPPPVVINEGYSESEPGSSRANRCGPDGGGPRGLPPTRESHSRRDAEFGQVTRPVDNSAEDECKKSDVACGRGVTYAVDAADTADAVDATDAVASSTRTSADLYGEMSLNSGISAAFMATPDDPSPVSTIFEKYPINRDSLPPITPDVLAKRTHQLKRPQRLSLTSQVDFSTMRSQIIRANRASQFRLESYALAMAATKKPRVPSPSKIPAPSPLREMKPAFCSYVPYKLCTSHETPVPASGVPPPGPQRAPTGSRPSSTTPARPTRIPSPIKPVKSPAGSLSARTSLLLKLARARGAIPDYLDYTQAPRALPEDDACSCAGSDFNGTEDLSMQSVKPMEVCECDLVEGREGPANRPSQFCLLASDPDMVASDYQAEAAAALDSGGSDLSCRQPDSGRDLSRTDSARELSRPDSARELSRPDSELIRLGSGLHTKAKGRTRLGGLISALYSKLDSQATSDEGASDQSTSRLVKSRKKRKLFRSRSKDRCKATMQSGASDEEGLCMRANDKAGLPGNGVLPTAVHGADLADEISLPHGTSFGSLSAGSGAKVHPTSRESDDDIVPNSTSGNNGSKANHSGSGGNGTQQARSAAGRLFSGTSGALDNGPAPEPGPVGNGPIGEELLPGTKPHVGGVERRRWKHGFSHLLRRSKSSTNNNLTASSPKHVNKASDSADKQDDAWNSAPNNASPTARLRKQGLKLAR